MSLEIERTKRRQGRAAAVPARPTTPQPSARLETFQPRAPRCRWPEGCDADADIWHQLYYCPVHKEEDRLAREARQRGYTDPLDLLLVDGILKVERRERRLRGRRIAQDATSHGDAYRRTPGGEA